MLCGGDPAIVLEAVRCLNTLAIHELPAAVLRVAMAAPDGFLLELRRVILTAHTLGHTDALRVQRSARAMLHAALHQGTELAAIVFCGQFGADKLVDVSGRLRLIRSIHDH